MRFLGVPRLAQSFFLSVSIASSSSYHYLLPKSDCPVTSFSLLQILVWISLLLSVCINMILIPHQHWSVTSIHTPPIYCLHYPLTWNALLLPISTYLKFVSSLILSKASVSIKHFSFH